MCVWICHAEGSASLVLGKHADTQTGVAWVAFTVGSVFTQLHGEEVLSCSDYSAH